MVKVLFFSGSVFQEIFAKYFLGRPKLHGRFSGKLWRDQIRIRNVLNLRGEMGGFGGAVVHHVWCNIAVVQIFFQRFRLKTKFSIIVCF